jgi:hypothetical protein
VIYREVTPMTEDEVQAFLQEYVNSTDEDKIGALEFALYVSKAIIEDLIPDAAERDARYVRYCEALR